MIRVESISTSPSSQMSEGALTTGLSHWWTRSGNSRREHARDRGRGFCLLANAAITVEHLRDVRGLKRVAMVDWDVHHGRASERMQWTRINMLRAGRVNNLNPLRRKS